MAEKVNELTQTNQRLAIWGCGAKTLSILAACPSDLYHRISFIIDSDPHKFGLYVPNTNIRVISPNEAINLQPEAILILALSYRQEIAAIAREKLASCNYLFTLDDDGYIKQM